MDDRDRDPPFDKVSARMESRNPRTRVPVHSAVQWRPRAALQRDGRAAVVLLLVYNLGPRDVVGRTERESRKGGAAAARAMQWHGSEGAERASASGVAERESDSFLATMEDN